MTNMEFELGGGGTQKYGEARGLPSGTKVRIVSIEPKESPMGTKKAQEKAQADGVEWDGEMTYQALVLFEALEPGKTVAFETGRSGSRRKVESEPFAAGAIFRHYYNGVYAKPTGGWRVSVQQNFGEFLKALLALGAPKHPKFTDYVGTAFILDRLRGQGAQGVYFTPLPKPVEEGGGLVDAPTAPSAPPAKKAPAPDAVQAPAKRSPLKKKAPVPTADNAFLALSAEDQAAVREYVSEQGGTAFAVATDLVPAVAKDEAHATAILAGLSGA